MIKYVVLLLLLQTPTDLVNQIQTLLDQLRTAVAPVVITTSTELDVALAAAAPGATLTLSPTLVYTPALTLTKAVTLQSVVPAGRMVATTLLPSFLNGIKVLGNDITLLGLEVKNSNHLTDIVVITGGNIMLDRVRILGDVAAGAKRGIAANGNGNVTIIRSYVDDCFQASPGNDSQAIIAWDMAPGLLIEDNFLRSGSEGVLLGGADNASAARIPTDVTIRGNLITARPEWMARAVGVKTRLELKAGKHVLIERNFVEYCWKQGQGGFLLTLTVRNQDGTSPWMTIEDVVIQDNAFSHGSAAINVQAIDDVHPSGRLARVTIQRNQFTDLDPVFYSVDAMSGSTKLVQISAGPQALMLVANTFTERTPTVRRFATTLYFLGAPRSDDLTVTGNTWMPTTYGVFGGGSTAGNNPVTGLPRAWEQYVASGTLSGNVER